MILNETIKTIKFRRSIRKYQDKQIEEEALQTILEAGSYAPNAGDQSWHFTVVQNPELLSRLNLAAKTTAATLNLPGLSALAQDENFHCLHHAPTLIIISGNEQSPVPLDADCAAATQNMLLAAESLGLGSCWIFFVQLAFQSTQGEELRSVLKIPESYRPYTAAVFGYKGETIEQIPERKPGLVTILS